MQLYWISFWHTFCWEVTHNESCDKLHLQTRWQGRLLSQHMKHESAWNAPQVNARETALSDSYATQPLSINNEAERSSTERERQRRGGGKKWNKSRGGASEGRERSREKEEEWQLEREIRSVRSWTENGRQLKRCMWRTRQRGYDSMKDGNRKEQ